MHLLRDSIPHLLLFFTFFLAMPASKWSILPSCRGSEQLWWKQWWYYKYNICSIYCSVTKIHKVTGHDWEFTLIQKFDIIYSSHYPKNYCDMRIKDKSDPVMAFTKIFMWLRQYACYMISYKRLIDYHSFT